MPLAKLITKKHPKPPLIADRQIGQVSKDSITRLCQGWIPVMLKTSTINALTNRGIITNDNLAQEVREYWFKAYDVVEVWDHSIFRAFEDLGLPELAPYVDFAAGGVPENADSFIPEWCIKGLLVKHDDKYSLPEAVQEHWNVWCQVRKKRVTEGLDYRRRAGLRAAPKTPELEDLTKENRAIFDRLLPGQQDMVLSIKEGCLNAEAFNLAVERYAGICMGGMVA